MFVDAGQKFGQIFVELMVWLGVSDAARAEDSPLLARDFVFAGGRGLDRAGFVDRDVVDKGRGFGGQFEITPPAEPRRIFALARNPAANIAAGKGKCTAGFIGLGETDVGRGGGTSGGGKVALGFVMDFLFAGSDPEFEICLRETDQARFRIMEGRAIGIEIIIVIIRADTVRILAVGA